MSIRRTLITVALAFAGLLAAASIGYASYLVSRDSVGLPVTKLERPPRNLAPARARSQQPAPVAPARTTTTDDRRGGSRGSDDDTGKSPDSSGSGRGGGSGSSGHGGDGDDD